MTVSRNSIKSEGFVRKNRLLTIFCWIALPHACWHVARNDVELPVSCCD